MVVLVKVGKNLAVVLTNSLTALVDFLMDLVVLAMVGKDLAAALINLLTVLVDFPMG